MTLERQAIFVDGVVQGVGFRPFVYQLACHLKLAGFVKNRAGSVLIEVEGERSLLDRFLVELKTKPPPLSIIDRVSLKSLPLRGQEYFRIEPSDIEAPINLEYQSPILVAADMAPCADCLAELHDPADRRYRYPFLNCINCGPRLTIIQSAPYDRHRTTLARFKMCAACQTEYDSPGDRRFHAQAIACPACGPQLVALTNAGERIDADDPLTLFADWLMAGKIGAMKGLGGYHLVCDARRQQVVSELRRRKRRDEKPFAIMVRSIDQAGRFCDFDSDEQSLLESPHRPIVLLKKRIEPSSDQYLLADALSPGNPFLGVMLSSTPLHDLLFEAVGEIPLVMTSGNQSDEPIAYLDDDAVQRLGSIAEIFLTHDRPIHVRCDDSVMRIVDGSKMSIRRSRGYAPHPIRLPFECPCPILAVGGQFKATFALGQDRHAVLSHHLGDLEQFEACRAFERDMILYERLFGIHPCVIAHDRHPDYASTGLAQRRAADEGIQLLAVQHHHAHMASCMAEHGLDEPVIGVSFDGTGFGLDSTIWGGEFLVGDYSDYTRAGHLRNVGMPGGAMAVHEPWRMALSHLLDADCDPSNVDVGSTHQRRAIEQMLNRGFNSPLTSSAGRLFDAVASIAGVQTRVEYEGQAAIKLEWLAMDVPECGTYPFELIQKVKSTHQMDIARVPCALNLFPFFIDTRPLIRAVVYDVVQHVTKRVIARRFHSTLVAMISAACDRIREQTHLDAVVLSGGCFMNALMTKGTCARLMASGFRVYRNHLVPPGDGGLSLGQLAIAARSIGRTPAIPDIAALVKMATTCTA